MHYKKRQKLQFGFNEQFIHILITDQGLALTQRHSHWFLAHDGGGSGYPDFTTRDKCE